MKRLLSLLLALVMALTLTACGSSDGDDGGKKLPDLGGKTTDTDVTGTGDPEAAAADLSWLRDSLRAGGYIFGTVSFGYVDGAWD